MLHQDGSQFAWLAGQPDLDLIVTMDDATSTIYSAFLVEQEGTASSFRALLEVFTAHGLPSSLYQNRTSPSATDSARSPSPKPAFRVPAIY